MPAQHDILQHCFQDAARAAKPALERCLAQVTADLQLLETKCMQMAERDEMSRAWRHILSRQAAWAERYSADILTELTQKLSALPSAVPTLSASGSPFAVPAGQRAGRSLLDAAGLVGDDDLTQSLQAQRLLQNVLPFVEQTLTELDALVSSALGLGHVAPERNPLKPETFTVVLQRLMTATLEDAACSTLAFKHMAKPLGRELAQIYSGIIASLKKANVASASYQFRVQPASPQSARNANRAQAGASGFNGFNGSQGANTNESGQTDAENSHFAGQQFALPSADLSDSHLRSEMLRDFLNRGGQVADQGLAAPYYDDIEQELAALTAAPESHAAPFTMSAQSRLSNVAPVDRPQRTVDASTPLSEQVWGPYGTSRARSLVRTQLKKEATKVSQALGLDVVRQLVNQVAQDPRLLAPVREAIVALEPSLLRLALVDPRFFTDERHAGRQLMERVAQRSFKHNDEFSPEFAEFFGAVTPSFNQLNASDIADAQPFAAALAALDATWNALDQQDFDKRQQVLQALRFAEERQDKADQIAFDLSARSDLDKVPGCVLDFLFGPWALVMAHARLKDTRNQIDPEGYGSVVPNLVWSVKRDVTLKQPAKLIEMIPGLLDKLHSGLGLLGQEPQENEAFFESLMKLHRPVLKLRRLKSQRDAEESNTAPLEPEEAAVSPAVRLENLRAQAETALWMGRSDLDAAGFEDTLPTEPADLTAMEMTQEPLSGTAPESPQLPQEPLVSLVPSEPVAQPVGKMETTEQTKEQAAAVLQSLKTGRWVDLYSKRQWLRAQLVWASSQATLFMFISHGGQPHSMTKRSCEKLIAQRLLRPVGSQGVVAQALDAVVQEAAALSRQEGAQAFNASSASSASSELEIA